MARFLSMRLALGMNVEAFLALAVHLAQRAEKSACVVLDLLPARLLFIPGSDEMRRSCGYVAGDCGGSGLFVAPRGSVVGVLHPGRSPPVHGVVEETEAALRHREDFSCPAHTNQ